MSKAFRLSLSLLHTEIQTNTHRYQGVVDGSCFQNTNFGCHQRWEWTDKMKQLLDQNSPPPWHYGPFGNSALWGTIEGWRTQKKAKRRTPAHSSLLIIWPWFPPWSTSLIFAALVFDGDYGKQQASSRLTL